MNTGSRFSLRTLVKPLGVVFASLAGGGVLLADSAVGVNTILGNALNPSPYVSRPPDTEWPVPKHTPTGQLFRTPFAAPDVRKAVNGWEYSGQVEFGYIGGDADEQSAQFRTYQDIDNGAYLNNFRLEMRKPEGGYSIDLVGGGAGRHDQYYGLQFGRYNDWKVKVFFSEIPHVFTNRYKSLWNGIGTDNLTLLPGLTPGGTTSTTADNANVAAAADNEGGTLSLTRKRSGVRFDMDLWKTWKAYVSYTHEKRKGARPFGAVWGNTGGTAPIEIPEPIDYDTQDILAGLQHVDGLNAFNLRFSASIFQNNLSTLTFQEPYRIGTVAGVTTVPAAGAYTQGRFDLTPSNNALNARAEYTRSMPDFHKGHFTAVVSAGTWRQDDTLIPHMITPSVSLANVMLLPGGNWDSATALSRRSANARIDTRLVDLTLSLNPSDTLNVKTKARFHETDNETEPFLAVNPNAVYTDADAGTTGNQSRGLTLDGMTGAWGRPLNDGSGQSILLGPNSTPAGNIAIKSVPYSGKQFRFGIDADQRLAKVSSLNVAVDREIMEREHRNRKKTWEDKLKLGYVNRGLGDSTMRVSYAYGRRRGSRYVATTYNEYFSPALVPMPTTDGTNVSSWVRMNSGFRALDLANRNQHVVNGRLDTMLRPNLDAGLSLQLRKADFPDSDYGRTGQKQGSANVDLNYQPSTRQTIYAFYSYQRDRFSQASIAQGNTNVVIGQASALGVITPANAVEIGSTPGGPVFPLLNAWTAASNDRSHVVGFGLKQDFRLATLNIDYSWSSGTTRINYDYTVGGAINAANSVFAGSRMPDLSTAIDYLDASLLIPLTGRLSARLVCRYQKETIRDWHYRNVHEMPVVLGNNGAAALPTIAVLDGGPQAFEVSWYGVMFQLKL